MDAKVTRRSRQVCALVFVWGILILCRSASAQDPAPSVKDLIANGDKLIKQKKLPEALTLLLKAVGQDPKSAAAQYGLARVYALLRKDKKTCELEAYRSTILEHLQEAAQLDHSLVEKMKKDRDLEQIFDTFGFQRILGLDPLDGRDTSLILQRVSWYGPCPGAYGPQSGMKLGGGGKMVFWVLDVSGAKPKKIEYPGSYTLKSGSVQVKLKKPFEGKTEFQGTLSGTGNLEFENLPGPLGDDLCECEA